eukprot:TRINITY_DN5406_c2_g2_i1.p1 TRINITY_DN5406_c2_g2~~TRINITY_DN5406_c2_g2_i1.p1  ORF type:complete len:122 (-),score=18.97 TRINITY_DN5406_c2_g2_i1:430-795(-)
MPFDADTHLERESWNCFHQCTAEYETRAVDRFITDEFVQRYSKRLLDEIDAWLAAGASAWSQQMSPTICRARCWNWRPLESNHIGHAWAWDTRVSSEEWQDFCDAVTAGRDIGKWFHALKF